MEKAELSKHNFVATVEFDKFGPMDNLVRRGMRYMVQHEHYGEMPELNLRIDEFRNRLIDRLESNGLHRIDIDVTGLKNGSLVIFFTVIGIYEAVSKYKNFSESIDLVVKLSTRLLREIFGNYEPVDVIVTEAEKLIDGSGHKDVSAQAANKVYGSPSILKALLVVCIMQLAAIAGLAYELSNSNAPMTADLQRQLIAQAQHDANDAKRIAEDLRFSVMEMRLANDAAKVRPDETAKILAKIEDLVQTTKTQNSKRR